MGNERGCCFDLIIAVLPTLYRYFSESFLQYVGGSLFLVFAAATMVDVYVQLS